MAEDQQRLDNLTTQINDLLGRAAVSWEGPGAGMGSSRAYCLQLFAFGQSCDGVWGWAGSATLV